MAGIAYVFIDRNTHDYQYLMAHVKPGYQVILLENDRDGVTQITETLQNSREVTEVHLVTHGSPGCLYLGNTHLNLENLNQYANLLQQWRNALADRTGQCADLLLYGCRVAEQGWSEFSGVLSVLTGTNIAASSTEVGNGKWELDQRQGTVTAALAFSPEVQQHYSGSFSVGYTLSNNSLIAFDTSNPDNPGTAIAITGLGTGENLVGIDVRPQNGKLYGLTSTGSAVRLYVISPQTGVATALTTAPVQFDNGAGTAVPITGTSFGLDFNPTVDRLRVVTDSGLNFRMNPNTGALIDGNMVSAGVNADGAINGASTLVDATAYTNNAPNVAATTQYTLNAANDTLSIQNPPNNGTQTSPVTVTLGGTRLDFTAVNGFDIPSGINVNTSNAPASGQAFAALTVGGNTGLYAIELSTGAATLVGAIGTGTSPAQGLAIQAAADTPLIGLTNANGLVRFNRSNPSTATTVAITGLAAGESIVGIDFRPATGQLFALSTNGTGGVRLSIIDPQTGAATPVTAGFQQFDDGAGNAVPIQATAFGIDFNPTVDRLRVVTNTGQNFRMNPNTGLLVDGDNGGAAGSAAGVNPDGSIKGSTTAVDATAYTNSFAGATATTQYTLDATSDRLLVQNPPNSGTQTSPLAVTLNGVPLDFTAVNGFDVPAGVRVTTSNTGASGRALAALTVGGSSNLYAIELSTGAATLLGAVGTGTTPLIGLAAADSPVGAVAFAAPTYSVTENGTSIAINLVRTGGSTGAFTVNLAATGGTATTADYSGLPASITFADGQTTATATLAITNDTLTEGNETLNLTLSSPTNGAVLAAQDAAVLTINEPLKTIRGNRAGETSRGGIGNDRILGLGGNDTLLGFGGNDLLDGGAGADVLKGGAGADLYLYAGRSKQAAFANSLIDAFDRISGFKVSEGDRIQLDFDNKSSTVNLPRRLFNAGQEGGSLANAVRTAYADKDQRTRGRQALAINEAVFFTVGRQTYLSVNDSQAGFSASRDLLVNVTGIQFNPGDATAGTLTVSNYFA